MSGGLQLASRLMSSEVVLDMHCVAVSKINPTGLGSKSFTARCGSLEEKCFSRAGGFAHQSREFAGARTGTEGACIFF